MTTEQIVSLPDDVKPLVLALVQRISDSRAEAERRGAAKTTNGG
jgi:hypothetical protein